MTDTSLHLAGPYRSTTSTGAGTEIRVALTPLAAHSTVCPLCPGPLDDVPVVDGPVRCPWHGYVFHVRRGRCPTKPGLSPCPAPAIRAEGGTVWAGEPVAGETA